MSEMTYEHPIGDGFTVQHYGPHDWFPVMGAGWWVREWLMCNEECRAEVEMGDDRAEWGEVVDMLRALGDTGPYGDGPVFAELTYNHENDLDNELLVAAGWVDVGKHALHRGMGSPLLRAIFAHMPEHDWDEIGATYIVAIAYGGCYGWRDAEADVYIAPNLEDDYDVARWGVQLYASETAPTGSYGGSHPVYDACGGWGDRIDGLGESSGYPYGVNEDRLPMYDVSDVSWDSERGCHEDGSGDILPATAAGNADGFLATYSGPWLACGEAGVFAVGTDGRVHRVYASVN